MGSTFKINIGLAIWPDLPKYIPGIISKICILLYFYTAVYVAKGYSRGALSSEAEGHH